MITEDLRAYSELNFRLKGIRRSGRSFFGSLFTTVAYDASMASTISSSGIAPPISRLFQPERPMYAMTVASPGYRTSHSSAISRLAPHLRPIRSGSPEPRKAKIFEPTFVTTSSSHGWSCHAPGFDRQ